MITFCFTLTADNEFVSAVLTQIHWTHHMVILSKTNTAKGFTK